MGGEIDLDPASCHEANETVGATRIYTEHEDGAAQPWDAERIWLNAPHSRHTTMRWVVRLERAWQTRELQQAVSIWPCSTTSTWFGLLWRHPVCFLRKRVRFAAPSGTGRTEDSPRESHVVVYHGRQTHRFIGAFGAFGPIALNAVCHE